MWNCEHCGCQAIAADLTECPMCREPRSASSDVPTSDGEEGSAGEPAAAGSQTATGAGNKASPQASTKAGKEQWK